MRLTVTDVSWKENIARYAVLVTTDLPENSALCQGLTAQLPSTRKTSTPLLYLMTLYIRLWNGRIFYVTAWKEAAVTSLLILSSNSPGNNEKHHEIIQSWKSVSQRAPPQHVRCAPTWTKPLGGIRNRLVQTSLVNIDILHSNEQNTNQLIVLNSGQFTVSKDRPKFVVECVGEHSFPDNILE